MAIKTGQTVGDYEIVDLIESSKDGVTYKVRNALLQRWESLRVLPKSLQDDQERVTRFLREAKVHARINHPNIVSFYHATQLAGQLIMTTELVEGTTLADRMELGPVPLPDALSYASQVLAALAHAHALGVVHRDITPSNIILTTDGAVKLTGFGLAKAIADPQLTQPGTVIGSLDYISPEQIKGLAELDGRTDIYSLGVVLYQLVTGRKPFEHTSQFEIMLAHVNTVPPAPSIVNPDVPAELSEIILTAMAKDPACRFQTADEFRQRLDQLRGAAQSPLAPAAETAPGAAQPAEAADAAETAQPELPAGPVLPLRDFWRLIAAGVFTFLLVVLTFYAFMRRS